MDHIDKLLGDLSSYELMYIRRRLKHISMWDDLATFSDLPVEIISEISLYLSLSGYMACRGANRALRSLLDSVAVVTPLAKLHFPGMVEMANLEDDSIANIFSQAALARIQRHRGFLETHVITWSSGKDASPFTDTGSVRDSESPSTPSPYGNGPLPWAVKYHDGKVVWAPGRSSNYLVDTLDKDQSDIEAARYRHRLGFGKDILGGYNPVRLLSITSNLIFFFKEDRSQGPSRYTLAVWHLQEQKWKNVRLPGHYGSFYSHDENAVIWNHSQPCWFSWKGGLTDLPVDRTDPLFSFLPKDETAEEKVKTGKLTAFAMFHPTNPDLVFLGWLQGFHPPNELSENHYHIIRYEKGLPVKSFHHGPIKCGYHMAPLSIKLCPDPYDFETHISHYRHVCQRASEYGSYLLMLRGTPNWSLKRKTAERVGDSYNSLGPDKIRENEAFSDGIVWSTCGLARPGDCDCERSRIHEWRGIYFNVCTENFCEYTYELADANARRGVPSSPQPWPWVGLYDYSYNHWTPWDNELWVSVEDQEIEKYVLLKYVAKELPVSDAHHKEAKEEDRPFEGSEMVAWTYNRSGYDPDGFYTDQNYAVSAISNSLTVHTFDKEYAFE